MLCLFASCFLGLRFYGCGFACVPVALFACGLAAVSYFVVVLFCSVLVLVLLSYDVWWFIGVCVWYINSVVVLRLFTVVLTLLVRLV